MSGSSIKVPVPQGEDMALFIDFVTDTILKKYMPAREKHGLEVSNDATMIRGIVSITIARLLAECGTIE